MLKPGEPCTACRKLVVDLELAQQVWCPLELPNTFDRAGACYRWKYHDLLGYLMIPHSVGRETGTVDLFVCIDDEDLALIDLEAYLRAFLTSVFQEHYPQVRGFELGTAERVVPLDVACRRRTHASCDVEHIRRSL